MQKLDRRRPFGRITPPYEREDFDRPAFYEQDGQFYDQHDRLIEPGKPLKQIVPHAPGPVTKDVPMPPISTVGAAGGAGSEVGVGGAAEASPDPLDHDRDGRKGGSLPANEIVADKLTADDLLHNPNIPWMTFKRAAMRLLGPSCPASKKAILDELQKAVDKVAAYQSEVRTNLATKRVRQPKGDPGPVTVKGGREIDLAAWARGQKDYLWGDVQRAIRQQFHRQVTARRDALETLIEEQVIPADAARKDIK